MPPTRSSTRSSSRRISTTPATPKQPPTTVIGENPGREGAGGSPSGSSRSHSPDPHLGEVNETGAASGNSTQTSVTDTVPPIRTAVDVVNSLPSTPLEGGEFIYKVCQLLTGRCGPHGEELSTLLQPILAVHPGFQPQDDEGFLYGTPPLLKELDWGKDSNRIVSILTKLPIFNTRWNIIKSAINYLSGQDKYLGINTTMSDLKLLSSARAKAVHEMTMIPRKASILHDRSPTVTAEDLSLKPLTNYEDLRDWVEQTESSFRKRGLTAYLSDTSHCKENLVLSEAYTEQIRVSLKDGPLSSLVQDKSVSDTSILFSTIKRELQSDKYRMVDQMKYWDDFFNLKLTDLGDTPAWKNKIETWVGKLTSLASDAVKDNTLIRAIILRSMQCKEHAEQKVAAYMDAQEDYKTLLEKVQTRYRTLTRIEGASVNSAAGRTIRRGSTTTVPQPTPDPNSKRRFNIPELPRDIDRILRDPARDRPLLARWRGQINQNRVSKPHKYYLFESKSSSSTHRDPDKNPSSSARSPRSDHRLRDRSGSQRARHRNTRRSRSRDSLRSPSRDSYYDEDHPRTLRRDSPRPSQRRRTDA